MKTQKIVNLLNDSNNENWKSATKKWYIIDSEAKGNYKSTKVAFKNCAPFKKCRTEINETFVDEAVHNIIAYV